MAQHDYVIDNSTGANVRADINSVLQAIASNNSGSSAPSTTYALQTFANTTDSMLQLRNAANNAFVNLRKFDGTLPLPDGSASSPSLFMSDDTNTGLFSSAADTLNFTTGGVERMELGATTIFNEDGADVDFRIEGDTEANLFYVDAGNSRIGVGTNSPQGTLDLFGDSNSNGPELFLRVNNNNTVDNIGSIFFGNNVDASLNQILGGTSGANNSSYLAFSTSATGTLNEVARFTSEQEVLIGASSYGGGGADPTLYIVGSSGRTVKIHASSGTSSLQLTTTGSNQGEDTGLQLAMSGTAGIITNHQDDSIQCTAGQSNTNKPVINFIKPNGPNHAQTVMITFESGNQGRGAIKSSSSDGSSPSFAANSDYRIKTNIRDYTDGYNNIKAIPVKLFDITSDGTKDIKGWIAHEVQAYIPEAVMGEKDAIDSDGKAILQNLSYGLFMPDVVGALQTAIAKIEVLETKVAALESA